MHIEYVCTQCGETYLPEEPGDAHETTEDGLICQGLGKFLGVWLARGEHWTNREQHMWGHPGCTDPDCEFHHPERREFLDCGHRNWRESGHCAVMVCSNYVVKHHRD